MKLIDYILEKPSYGWQDSGGNLVKPTTAQLWKEALSRVNIFRCRKNWISFLCLAMLLFTLPFVYFFIFEYFSFGLLLAFIGYSMIVMGTHGTIWYHRYCTHKSYKFSHPAWRFITQNLVVKTIPEELYVISHHVHHAKSDVPGDPYNARGGFLYCMLSDFNHQRITPDLDAHDYSRAARMMHQTGVDVNSYMAYKQWGSVSSPFYSVAIWILNWSFWYTLFFLLGGHALACTLFSAALFWFLLVPAFNYTGHGSGAEKHVDGVDFDRSNLSINQVRPGYFAGEWHNNHHLFPASARSGFLPYQLDLPWVYIYCLYKVGAVSKYHDSKPEFMKKYGKPAGTAPVR